MSRDIVYVRCAPTCIERANADRTLAVALMKGSLSPGEAWGVIESIDFDHRRVDELYRLLAVDPTRDHWRNVGDPEDWLAVAVNGYETFNWTIDTGYGCPRFLQPAMVVKIAAHLAAVTDAKLREAFSVRSAAKLLRPGGASDFEHLHDAFCQLRDFFAASSNAGQCVVITPLS